MTATTAPAGIAHLENPDLTTDLTVARDFDLGITGPPLSISMDFIASGLVEMVGGLATGVLLFGYSWWAAPVLIGAWVSTHYLLRESAVWQDRNTDEVRNAQRHSEYAYRLAVDPPAAKELRLFGLSDWVIDRFTSRRRRLYELQWESTRLRERKLGGSLAIVLAANALVAWSIAERRRRRPHQPRPHDRVPHRDGRHVDDRVRRLELGARRRGRAGGRAQPARAEDGRRPGSSPSPRRPPTATGMPAREIRFRDVTFAYRPDLPAGARRLRPHDPGRHVDGDRRRERRGQDHARQAALPPLRPAAGEHRDRRRRPARRSIPTRGAPA